jgi:iron complex outermembrane receptor protein
LNRAIVVAVLLFAVATRAQESGNAQPPASAPEAGSAQQSAGAQQPNAQEPIDLPQAGMSARVAGEHSVINVPQSVDIVNRAELQRNEGLFLDDTLNLLPGVRFESRTLSGGQRITIRGYGNSTNFNGSGYKAYLDGVPLTDAEGTTILNDVDPSTLGRIEVIKGPASSLYGAGIGGVVKFFTLQPEPNTTKFTQETVAGTEGLIRTNTRAENADSNSAVVLNYGHQQGDGYRAKSESDRDYALFTANYRPNAKQSLFVYASYDHAFDHLPGEMSLAQFLSRDSNYFDPVYVANHAHIAIDSARLGLSHKYAFTPNVTNTTSLFGTEYTLDQPSAAGLTDNSVNSVGGRTETTAKIGFSGGELDLNVGTELERSNAFKKSYNLNTDGSLGGIKGDLQVVSLQSNTFLEAVAKLPQEFEVTAGASLDYVRYAIQDRLANSANPKHANQGGAMTFDPVVTPRVAVAKMFGSDLSVYGQISRGYTPPASSSIVIPASGTVNSALRPERGILYEAGSKGSLFDGRFTYDAALFDLVVQDKLTPQTITDQFGTYTITTNAGKQNDVGLELAAKYALVQSFDGPLRLVQVFGSYAYSSFHYDGFKNNNNNNATTIDYTGKSVVGVPPHVVTAGLDIVTHWGIYANGTFEHVSPMPILYDNSQSAPAYGLLDAKIGYRTDIKRHLRLDLSAGARNLTNSTYYTEVFLNASNNNNGQGIYLNGPYTAQFYGMLLLSYVL